MWTMPRSVLRVVAVVLALCAVGGFVLGLRGAPERARLPGEAPQGGSALQASEALKLVAGVGTSLAGRLLMLDGRSMEWSSLRTARNPACPVCGTAHIPPAQ